MKTKVIGVISGKGGTGKTTTAINLGMAMNLFGQSVTVVDANLTTPNVGVYLGTPILKTTLHDVLRGKKRITQALYQHKSGTRIVPASIALKDLKRINPKKLPKAVNGLRGTCDVVLIDSAAGLGREALAAIKSCDEIIILTNPELPSLTDALKASKLCNELKKEVLGVVVAKTNSRNVDLPLKDIEKVLEIPIIGIIPEDRAVKFAQADKEAVVHYSPKSAAAIQYKKLAANVLEIDYEEKIESEKNVISVIVDWFLGR